MALKFFVITFHHYLSSKEIEDFLKNNGILPLSSLNPASNSSDLYAGSFISVSTQLRRYAVEVPTFQEKNLLNALQNANLVATICDGGVVYSPGKKKALNKKK